MKKVEENALLQEMNLQEAQEVNGGWVGSLLVAFAINLAWDTLNDLDGAAASCGAGRSKALEMY